MAKVKYPLHSLSASGSIGNSVCYHLSPIEGKRTILRTREGTEISAEYPPRRVSGQGIARLKPQQRNDLRKRRKGINEPEKKGQALIEAQFRFAQTIARWIVRNDLTVSNENPANQIIPVAPWSDGLYFQRGENREQGKFPGQEVEKNLSMRRETTGTTTQTGFVMRQLLSRQLVRFDLTLAAWQGLSNEQLAGWIPAGNAPWDQLPQIFDIPGTATANRTFANIWIQAGFLIPQFELLKGWLNRGQTNAVWISPFTRPDNDPVIIAWQRHLNSDRDFEEQPVKKWSS